MTDEIIVHEVSLAGNQMVNTERARQSLKPQGRDSSNYLKTEEELDVDIYQMYRSSQVKDCTSIYLQIIENKDGYINISIPTRIDSGFMEENY